MGHPDLRFGGPLNTHHTPTTHPPHTHYARIKEGRGTKAGVLLGGKFSSSHVL
jgi:hypothetical protein